MLKFHQIYLKICTLYNMKAISTNLSLIFEDFISKICKTCTWTNCSQTTTSLIWKFVYNLRVSLKALNMNLTGFNFSQISLLMFCNFYRINLLLSRLKSLKNVTFLREIEFFYITFFTNHSRIHQLMLLQNEWCVITDEHWRGLE